MRSISPLRRLLPLLLVLGLAGCAPGGYLYRLFHPAPAGPAPTGARYTIGAAYQADGVWHYPVADFSYDHTGLAAIYPAGHLPATADGEEFSQEAMAAASQTLQLPAIARVTNLATGQQVLVRVNDRGPANPGRVVELTHRAAALLGIPEAGGAAVRVHVLSGPSRALQDSLGAGMRIKTAPVGTVQATALPPPGSAAGAQGPAVTQTFGPRGGLPAVAVPPLRLPETTSRVPPRSFALYVQSGAFGEVTDAARFAARIGGLGAHVVSVAGPGRTLYAVQAGPLPDVARADAALRAVLAAGGADARIVAR